MKTFCRFAGYNDTHAYYHSKEETNPFADTMFVDIPKVEFFELGSPMSITVTIEAGNHVAE